MLLARIASELMVMYWGRGPERHSTVVVLVASWILGLIPWGHSLTFLRRQDNGFIPGLDSKRKKTIFSVTREAMQGRPVCAYLPLWSLIRSPALVGWV